MDILFKNLWSSVSSLECKVSEDGGFCPMAGCSDLNKSVELTDVPGEWSADIRILVRLLEHRAGPRQALEEVYL